MARRSMTPRTALAFGILIPTTTVLLGAGLVAAPVHAASRVTVANSAGEAVVDPTYATTVTVKGDGFQSLAGGFGGVYVGFGTVKGTWRPSQGGKTGVDYWYVPDSEEQANQGLFKFISYPGSGTADSANGGTISARGSWTTSLVIPGASFQAMDRNGKAATIDCRKVTCGVITFGAHGIVNGANETFTPVTFDDLSAGERTKKPVEPAKSQSAVAAELVVDRATGVAGRALTFTARGLQPGEQVVVSLDDGISAVGPLVVGTGGDVAGVVSLPADLTAGTHQLRLTSALSKKVLDSGFAVRAVAPEEEGSSWLPYGFVATSALLAVLALANLVRVRRRRARA